MSGFLSPRTCRAQRYAVTIYCAHCRVAVEASLSDPAWKRHEERGMAEIWLRPGLLCRKGCGRLASHLTVERWVGGLGSQKETLMSLSR